MEKVDHPFLSEFRYKHSNPYHDRLENFSAFVLRDHEGEKYQAKWSSDFFHNSAPLHVEVGSGYGHFMQEYCSRFPDVNYIGLDYRFKRSFHLAQKLKELPQQNFCFLRAKGERLEFLFGKKEIATLFFFFPDPWPKTRHQKKRLFNIPFLKALHSRLKTGGKIYLKTDHPGYFKWIEEKLALFDPEQKSFKINFHSKDLWKTQHAFLCSFQTKFEKIFIQQKLPIHALELECL